MTEKNMHFFVASLFPWILFNWWAKVCTCNVTGHGISCIECTKVAFI